LRSKQGHVEFARTFDRNFSDDLSVAELMDELIKKKELITQKENELIAQDPTKVDEIKNAFKYLRYELSDLAVKKEKEILKDDEIGENLQTQFNNLKDLADNETKLKALDGILKKIPNKKRFSDFKKAVTEAKAIVKNNVSKVDRLFSNVLQANNIALNKEGEAIVNNPDFDITKVEFALARTVDGKAIESNLVDVNAKAPEPASVIDEAFKVIVFVPAAVAKTPEVTE
jgi:hypothetical protein